MPIRPEKGGRVKRQPPVASPSAQRRLEGFAAALADVCDKFGFDIRASTEASGQIDVIDRRLRIPNYPWIAYFDGIDRHGLYNHCNRQVKRQRGFSLQERLPEDR